MTGSNLLAFPSSGANVWIEDYRDACLTQKEAATLDAYVRILHQFTQWVAERPGHAKTFLPAHLTTTAVEMYLSTLKEQGYSISHRIRVKSVLKQFCQWLIEEKEALQKHSSR